LRHARARHVWVELRRWDRHLELVIRDDGQGFDVAAAMRGMREGRGLGLLSMQERAYLFGGRLQIESVPGQGTTLRIEFPLPSS
jgi:signal transduction histidine kinase